MRSQGHGQFYILRGKFRSVRALFILPLLALSLHPTRAQQTINYTDGENNTGTITITGSVNPTTLSTVTGSATQSGAISDSGTAGAIIIAGSGTLTLTAANTYTGATTISAGTLALGSGGAISSSSGVDLTTAGATFDISNAGGNQTIQDLSGTFGSTVNMGNNGLTLGTANSTEFDGSIMGSGFLDKTGSGTLTLTGTSNMGDLNVLVGSVVISQGGHVSTTTQSALGTTGSTGNVTVDGTGSTLTIINGLTVGTANGHGTLTISNGGAVNTGVLALSNNAASGGTVNLDSGGVLSVSGVRQNGGTGGTAFNFNGGILRATAANTNFMQNFSGTQISFQSGGGTIDNNGFDIGIVAPLNGTGSVTFTGTATTTLTGTSTYTGSTTVNEGTLAIASGGSISNTDAVLVDSTSPGAALTVDGTGSSMSVSGTYDVDLTSTSTPSGIFVVGETGTGSLVISNGGTVNVAVTLTDNGGSYTGVPNSHASVIGDQAGSVGTVTVTGTGSLWNSGDLSVGVNGSGTMTISNGGSVVSGLGEVGYNHETFLTPSGTGMATITGAGSSWDMTGLLVGTVSPATGSGTGTVVIADGGKLSVSGGTALFNGSMTVEGVNANGTASSLVLSGGTALIDGPIDNIIGYGRYPAMTVNVGGGGQVKTSNTTGIGVASKTMTVVNITGVDAASGIASTWTDTGTLYIGYIGAGMVNVEDGGQFVTSNVTVADYNMADFTGYLMNPGNPTINETGTVNVTGVNANGTRSTWTVNSLTVATDGVNTGARGQGGFINILDGGDVSAGELQLGSVAIGTFPRGAIGHVTVSGVDAVSSLTSTLNVTGTVSSNWGQVTVADGGKATVGALDLFNSSQLIVEGVNAGGEVSTLAVNGDLAINITTTNSGTTTVGFVTVEDGGLLTSSTAELATSSGANQVTVTGTNANGTASTWRNAGNLVVGQSGTGTLTISNNALVSSGTVTLSGNPGGQGTLNLQSGGVLATSQVANGTGTNAFLNFDGGILRATATSTHFIGSGVNVTLLGGGGTFDNGGFAIGLSVPLTGTGAATFTGTGTTTLTGTNTYTGATTINAGTLAIGPGGNISTSSGVNLAAAGSTFDISNGGGQTIQDLSGTFGSTVNLGGNSLIVGTANSTEFDGSIIGSAGSINKVGTGTLILAGANTFSGGTTINAGTLAIANSTALGAGDVTNNGTLMTSSGNHLINIGGNYTQGANGTLVLNLSSPTVFDSVHLTSSNGVAHLNGTLRLNLVGNFAPGAGQSFTLIATNNPVDGKFSAVTTNLPSIGGVVNYSDDVTVLYQQPFVNLSGMNLSPNQKAVAAYIDTHDLLITDAGFASLVAALNNASGNPQTLASSFDQLTPLKFASFASTTAFNNNSFSIQQFDSYLANHRGPNGTFVSSDGGIDYSGLAVNDPLVDPGLQSVHSRLLAWSSAPNLGLLSDSGDAILGGMDLKDDKEVLAPGPVNLWNVYVSGNVILGQGFSNPTAGLSYSSSTTGAVGVGADYKITPHWLVGAAFDYGHTNATLDTIGSNASVNTYSPAVYTSYGDKGWYVNGLASYGFANYTQNRNVAIGAFTGTATSSPGGGQVVGDIDGGYDFHRGPWTFGPTLGLDYTHLTVDGYTETGLPGANLTVAENQADSLRSLLGGRINYTIKTASLIFTPHFSASWQHEYLNQSRGITSQFNSVGAGSFVVNTPNVSSNSALADIGLDTQINNALTGFVDYSVQAGQSNYFGQSIQAGFKIGF
jgi:T5SS/PEP-CTERM-associated repeat protein/autotransporter-associated beta strand protein